MGGFQSGQISGHTYVRPLRIQRASLKRRRALYIMVRKFFFFLLHVIWYLSVVAPSLCLELKAGCPTLSFKLILMYTSEVASHS